MPSGAAKKGLTANEHRPQAATSPETAAILDTYTRDPQTADLGLTFVGP